jgi:hypothetical protein
MAVSVLLYTIAQLLTCSRWDLQWRDPYEIPRLLQGMKRGERDQRESEKTTPNPDDSDIDDRSVRESTHESDEEPTAPNFPLEIDKGLFTDGEADLPVPLGAYVQFDSIVRYFPKCQI